MLSQALQCGIQQSGLSDALLPRQCDKGFVVEYAVHQRGQNLLVGFRYV